MIDRLRTGLAVAVLVSTGFTFAAPPEHARLTATIDKHIAATWKANEVTLAPRASDAEFLRRVYLDLVGRIPLVSEVRKFLDDKRPDKRQRLVEDLLDGEMKDGVRSVPAGYINHFSTIWRREWLPQTVNNPQFQFFGPQFETWLRTQLRENVAYDQLVRQVLTAAPYSQFGGQPYDPVQAASAAFMQVNEFKPENIAAATARQFLGVKIECAQCHDHPFETWKRQQFWEFASFFAGLTPINNPRFNRTPAEAIEVRSLTIPDLNQKVSAKFLDNKVPEFKDKVSSRVTLADWMTAKDNPYFARNAVNRMWAHFFGRGLIDPVDEPNADNPPSHPELLKELARSFAASGYDQKFLIKAIVNSQAYQLSSAAPGASGDSDRTFSRMRVRGLTPEQLFDSLVVATYYRDPQPVNQRQFVAPNSARGEFLAKFNSTERLSDVQTSILQALTLMNGRFIGELTSLDKSESLAAVVHSPFMSTPDKIEALFLGAVSRKPTTNELAKLTAYVDKGGPSGDPKKALADVFWALLNSSEFGFNH